MAIIDTAELEQSLAAYAVPEHLHDGLILYVTDHVLPGGFLSAVLRNDLLDAFNRADDESMAAMPNLVKWLYNCAPSPCWRSADAVRRWTEKG